MLAREDRGFSDERWMVQMNKFLGTFFRENRRKGRRVYERFSGLDNLL